MIRVSVFSESAYTVQGHGVHTAFEECLKMLWTIPNVTTISPIELRSSDILHVHSSGPAALALMINHRGPKVISAHLTPDSFIGSIGLAESYSRLIDRYLRYLYNSADMVLAVSETTAAYLQNSQIRPTIKVIPNAIDCNALDKLRLNHASLRNKLRWPEGRPVVLGVGQIQPRKGIDEFIECARNTPGADFVWVGGFLFGALSADRVRLEAAIRERSGNLTFTGLLPRPQTLAYYAAADIFFSPSKQETFGLAVLEAAAAGLPLVLSDIPTHRAVFRDAYLPAATNASDVIKELISSRSLQDEYGMRARKVASSYDLDVGAAHLMDAYNDALAIAGA